MRRKPSTGSGHGPPDARAVDVGRELHQARLGFNESLPQVAAQLRIREHYLAALEEGHLGALPGRIYALGFARAYAGHLGLDAEVVVARLRPGIEQTIEVPALATVVPPAERRSVTATIVTVCLAALAGGYVAYHALSETGEPALERVAEVPVELPSLAEPPVPAGSPLSDEPPLQVELPPQIPVELTTEPPSPPALADAASAVAAELPDPGATGTSSVTSPLAPAASSLRAAAGAADAAAAGRVELVANESSWVQVRSPTRDFFRMLTLEPGERLILPDRADLALWTGNAGGLEVQLDGQRLGVVGRRGAIVRDLPLAPDGLRDRLVP